ncbi:pilus assembly protein PilM [Psychrobacillus sp. Sa2BUA9]|uniref:Pilus assembly protein PilM n=1 Tax=Psychrobacillus faecigallinarum TaxID=2762235 RepID=A0ABR8R6Q4_9BACI|nr:pilus assembly protein PilM [Psychrobacillus faecigallinarum]MBD7943487.1 pilus assembly protein PilM [Psychrobacillus faecigallinarum]
MSSTLFALDIGTRSVVGIILEQRNETFHVVDILVEEHKDRAMMDGQIHNVLKVAEVIQLIKEKLEAKHGPLEKVSVAAAGRALKTEQAEIKMNIKNRPIFSEEDVSRLELSAVQQAQNALVQPDNGNQSSHYYCVGYSVLYYKLDGEEIGSLVDQQGEEASIEVIATFLPRVVVESLISALKRANLEMEALTLEPIAAINVLIPTSMRRLNVALVDIGAGTSDIAITDFGTVVAYGMVPYAGDEITEALSDHYLLDFPLAEKAKRAINTNDYIQVQDILGFEQDIPKEEVIEALKPTITELATEISKEILRLNNNRSPKAVMLVGGGSLTPTITTSLEQALNLPANRVAVRGIDAIQDLTKEEHIPITPELVTPIGIAIAAKKSPIQYMSVKVNGQVVRLFELKEMTVGDALLAANISTRKLYGKPGAALSIQLNNQTLHIPGEHGQAALIMVNGMEANTKTIIKNKDTIELLEGKDGNPGVATVRDLLDEASVQTVTFQGVMYIVEPKIYINGASSTIDTPLKERDKVTVETVQTVEQFLHIINKESYIEKLNPYTVTINDKNHYMPVLSPNLLINGMKGKLQSSIQDNDVIVINTLEYPTLEKLAEILNKKLSIRTVVTFQSEKVELFKELAIVSMGELTLQGSDVIPNNAKIVWEEANDSSWIFQDVFRFTEWTLPENATSFQILRNGQPSRFDEEIFGGDQLEIRVG